MCGIAGIIYKNGKKVEKSVITEMTEVMVYRGPDAMGSFLDNNFGMGHRRLSIVDLSEKGTQPMFSYDRRYVIAYNGEIYNYLVIKKELQKLGGHFQNNTDTEVILEAYRIWGIDCTKRFNGMWSFALYDIEKRCLFLSRDRFGVKPLYILDREDVFVFASEIKCITAVFSDEKVVDEIAVARYMHFIQEDADEHTFYKNIQNFPRATNMKYLLKDNRRINQVYWRIDVNKFKKKWKTKNPYRTFRRLLEDAVRIRLQADVPVGASLSGGLDSSTIVSIAKKKYHTTINTFSSIYKEKECNEKEFIDCVNIDTGANAHYIYPDKSENILEDLKKLIYYHDGPCESASPYSGYCVYRGVGNKVKVLLDGQGADELFAGYVYLYKYKIQELLEKKSFFSQLKAIGTLGAYYSVWLDQMDTSILLKTLGVYGYKNYIRKYRVYHPRQFGLEKDLFTEKLQKIDVKRSIDKNKTIKGALNQKLYEELYYSTLPRILHDVDRNSMAHSLEVRLPFLDYRIVEFSYTLDSKFKIRNSWTKYIMRKSLKCYLPKKIYSRKQKMGFPAPFGRWLRDKKYKEKWKEYIDAFKDRGIVEKSYLEKYYREHMNGEKDRSVLLFHVIALEIWLQENIDSKEEKWCLSK